MIPSLLVIAAPFVQPPNATDLDPALDVVRIELTAEELGEGRYAYNGGSPGPTIRVELGQTLMVQLTNNLTTPTTIHWHGVSVPFNMDGVTWMRDPVQPGGTFTYVFAPTQPGTFWYHPHFDTAGQVDGGLYGMLIVEDSTEPSPEEVVMIFDAANEHGPLERRAHGHGRVTTTWLVNGVDEPELTLTGGTIVRARLLNASNAGYLAIPLPSGATLIGSDQGLLSAPSTETVILGPGDRADVELLIGETGFAIETERYSLNGGPAYGDPMRLIDVAIDTPAAAPLSPAWPFSGGDVSTDPGTTDLVYVFQGSDRTRRWRINGEAFPNVTVQTLALGQQAILEVRNVSPTEHPFHLHGLHFEVLSVNGVPPIRRTVEDTINIRIRERVRLRVVADNPGDWMLHCHILPHAEDGMMTVLRVQ